MWCWRLLVILCAMLGVPNVGCAQDQILERSYFEDPTGALTWGQVQQQAFERYDGILNKGYSKSAFWVRLKINRATTADSTPNASGLTSRWVVRIQPSYLDEIALFDALTPTQAPLLVGDRHPPPINGYHSLNHNFVIAASDQPRWIWLRLKTNSTNLMHVEVLPMDVAIAHDRRQDFVFGIYIGTLILFLAWSGIDWLTGKDRMVGVFAINQLIVLLLSLAFLGYFRFAFGDSVPAPWLDTITNAVMLTGMPAGIWFHIHFLREFKPPAFCQRLLLGFLAMYPVELALLLMEQTRIALQINIVLIVLLAIVLLLMACLCTEVRKPGEHRALAFSRAGLVTFYGLLLVVLWLVALPMLGVIRSTDIALYGPSLYGFFGGFIILVTLQLRARDQQRVHLEARMDLTLAQQQVAQEQLQRKQQADFVAMLTHELKTPLSVVRMAMGTLAHSPTQKARADQAMQDMCAVIERCTLASKLDEDVGVVCKTHVDVGEQLNQLRAAAFRAEHINVRIEPGIPPLHTDAQLVRTVLSNLLDNALKYAAQNSEILVLAAVQMHGPMPGVSISVANRPGPSGRPDPTRVFQKYYRSAGAHQHTGSGLGLYLAAAMAERLGGALRYVPDHRYVRFECWLPI